MLIYRIRNLEKHNPLISALTRLGVERRSHGKLLITENVGKETNYTIIGQLFQITEHFIICHYRQQFTVLIFIS